MGLFDFFKQKNNDNKDPDFKKSPIAQNEQGEFNLKLSDFGEKINKAEVIQDGWIDPEFAKAFADLQTGEPMKKGDTIALKTYSAKIILWNRTLEVTFDPIAVKDLKEFVKNINQQLNWLSKNKDQVDGTIIRDLLTLKNNNWLEENQSPLNREDFLKSISPISITFMYNAAFELHYNDGNLFLGHTIKVAVNSKHELEAGIQG